VTVATVAPLTGRNGLTIVVRASRAAVTSRNQHEATRRTVLIAGAANILVGVVKLAAGIISGSSAMLAEAAHSAADTLDQLFLLTSLRQADRPADDDHPFGHGQERYFWSLLAAFGIFIAGAGFSFFEGILALGSTAHENPLAAYIALAVAVVAEGTSFLRALRQVRGEAKDSHQEVLDHVNTSPDITVKVALFEDSTAVVGLVFADRRAAGGGGGQTRPGQQGTADRTGGVGGHAAADPRGHRVAARRERPARAADHAHGAGQPHHRRPGRA